MLVRMGSKVSPYKFWYPGYYFCYSNEGSYRIYKYDSSLHGTIIQDTTQTAAIKQDGWNVLKVVANGSKFKFYINGTLLKSFTDSMRSSGYVGFEMIRTNTDPTLFMVDWAKLTVK